MIGPRPSAYLTSLVPLALLLGLTGCLGNRTGRPDETGTRNVTARSRVDRAAPQQWRQIVLDVPPKQALRGYLRTQFVNPRRPDDDAAIHWVYDTDFQLKGRISAHGRTYRYDAYGREREVGSFSIEHAILTLFGYQDAAEVSLRRMPPPA